jgi:hypothetical protein
MILRKAMAWGLGLGTLLALGACAQARPLGPVDGRGPAAGPLTSRAGGYELQVLSGGAAAPTFFQGGGTYVMGQLGERYTLRILNHTGRRIEAVVSVDGRDVVDGRAADYRGKRGYLVPAYGHVDIEGWRLSSAQVAAFRFSAVADSYAARTGTAREVGVIGAAIFPERFVPRPRPLELPYPRARSYFDFEESHDGYEGRGADAPSAAPADKSSSAGAPRAEAAPPSPSRSLAEAESARRRPGLGTEFGEAVGSAVHEVSFTRANPTVPAVVLGARYNDRAGLLAMGVDVDPYDGCQGWTCDRDVELRETARPFPVTERRYAPPPPCWNGRACR